MSAMPDTTPSPPTDLITELTDLQRDVAAVDEKRRRRDQILATLHQEYHVRQGDLAEILSTANEAVGVGPITSDAVWRAITRTLGHPGGRSDVRARIKAGAKR